MVQTYTMNQPRQQSRPNPYLNQKILTASPEQLIVYIYDAAITACRRSDVVKATKAIQLLIDSLNFENRELATQFFRTYSNILDIVGRKKFGVAENMIVELRQAWMKAMNIS